MEQLISILEDICETDEIRDNLDIDLFEAGLMDSLATVALLVEVESVFGVSIKPSEVTREDICSVNKLSVFLKERGIVL